MKEFELIARLTQSLPTNPQVRVGAGDDCAVLDLGAPQEYLLFKTDAVVEGVHFTKEMPPEKIGRKALGRCLSDIAAMGGAPGCALVTAGLPKGYDVAEIEAIYQGINQLARQHQVAVVGGETTLNPHGIFISVALIGTVGKEHCILRSGAKPGDALFVTGTLGGSFSGKHLDFEPRLEQGQWLARQFAVHAMIDLSDGLAGDLRHILNASGTGAELLASAIPVSRAARLAVKEKPSGKPPLLAALTDGEDFELLFTLSSRDAVRLVDAWKEQFPDLKLSCIGKITAQPGLRLRDRDGTKELREHAYDHFQKS